MMLPAVVARFWARDVTAMILISVASARSPAMRPAPVIPCRCAQRSAIILVAGALYAVSVLFGGSAACCARCFPDAIWKPEAPC